MYQNIVNNPEEWWDKKFLVLSNISELSKNIFGRNWTYNSFWRGLSFLVEDVNDEFSIKKVGKDLEIAFLVMGVDTIDNEMLNNLLLDLNSLQNIWPKSATADIIEANEINWSKLLASLGWETEAVKELVARLVVLDVETAIKVEETLKSIFISYNYLQKQFLLVGSLLLFYQTEHRYTVQELEEEIKNGQVPDWQSLLRFLGQSFYGNEADLQVWAKSFLLKLNFNKELHQEFDYYLFIIGLVFLILKGFPDFIVEERKTLIEKYFWTGFCLNAPWRSVLINILVDQRFLDEYLVQSATLAESLLANQEVVYFQENGDDSLTIGQFIGAYLAGSNNELEIANQENYVKAEIAKNSWPISLEPKLLGVLNLYLHLRDCDLIDFHHILGEMLKKDANFDWQKIISGEIDEESAENIKTYFKIVNRPFALRVELICAFMDLPDWQEDPYFSGILVLSQLYEELFSPEYGPLIYYSEKDNQWKLNTTRPNQKFV